MKGVNRFTCHGGMDKPSFHIIDRLAWFIPDIEHQVAIPSEDAILSCRVRVLNENPKSSEYWTKDEYIMVSVSQMGYKVGNYTARIIIRLGGDTITKIDSFGKPGPLYFEAHGKVMVIQDILRQQLEFAYKTKQTAPKALIRSLITTRDPGCNASEGRGIHITKVAQV